MTSDGISNEDWIVVQQYAADICNQSAEGLNSAFLEKKLVAFLGELEVKYGRLPSILSTLADYCDDVNLSLSLNKEAFVSASEISDFKNMSLISSILTELYLEEMIDMDKAKYWIGVLRECLNKFQDDDLMETFSELQKLTR